MLDKNPPGFVGLALKAIVAHTITYVFVGIPVFLIFNYTESFRSPEMACWMRPTNDPVIMAGPLVQPIRGFIFALAFFPIREILFGKKNGWLITWWLLVALGILSTFGPAPGSIEGMVYTILPVSMATYLEIVLQSFSFSILLFYWITNPDKKWLGWLMGVVFAILMLLIVIGLVTTYGA
ncbi:MAG: hypothetical protein HZB51_04530 [Chloroflexi bacterium]|nr:hypothetical protein [Chloroflexota bacterium]